MKRIPKPLYAKIAASIPVLCVDLLIERGGKVLLVKRLNEPLKGDYWPVGGRVLRDERLEDAARRIAKEEVGLSVRFVRFFGIYEGFFKKSAANPKRGIHTVSVVFRCEAPTGDVKLDEQSEKFLWSTNTPRTFIRNLKFI